MSRLYRGVFSVFGHTVQYAFVCVCVSIVYVIYIILKKKIQKVIAAYECHYNRQPPPYHAHTGANDDVL